MGTGIPRASWSRAVGVAALPLAAYVVLRWVAGAWIGAVGAGASGAAVSAGLLFAAGLGLAPWIGRRLGGATAAAVPSGAVAGAFGAGAAAALALALLLLATHGLRMALPSAPPRLAAALWTAVLAAALAYAEESFARGAAFSILQSRAGASAAVWGSAALLAIADLVTGAGFGAALTMFGLGLWWGRLRARTGGPAPAVAAHVAWNLVLGPATGIGGEQISGFGPSLLGAHLGTPWWSGLPGAAQGGGAALLVAAVAALLALRRPASTVGT